MAVFGEICKCLNQTRHRAEGRLIVCDNCGKPISLPFCKDCKWFQENSEARWPLERYWCGYPIHNGTDLITGEESIDNYHQVEWFRQNKCTPRAIFFEPRDK